jgi:flagellar motility protein MotE (MotC chaperone)
MPKVTITRAAKLAGISRQQLYDGYIGEGKITVDRDDPKKPKIDTAEILRVFGTLQDDNTKSDNALQDITPEKTEPYNGELNETVRELIERLRALEAQNQTLEALAKERKERIEALQEQASADREERNRLLDIVEKHTRLLSAAEEQRDHPHPKRSWWTLWGRRTA